MPQSCLNYNALEDKTPCFHCILTSGFRFDISKSPVRWAALEALNNNIILVGDDVEEGYPTVSNHHITVESTVHVCVSVCVGV